MSMVAKELFSFIKTEQEQLIEIGTFGLSEVQMVQISCQKQMTLMYRVIAGKINTTYYPIAAEEIMPV